MTAPMQPNGEDAGKTDWVGMAERSPARCCALQVAVPPLETTARSSKGPLRWVVLLAWLGDLLHCYGEGKIVLLRKMGGRIT